MIVDCHVNIWNHDQVTSLWREQMERVRPDGAPGLLADADTLFEAMEEVDKAIVFPIRYGDSAGVESDDETCAACVAKYPSKFIGFAYVDPRRPDYMERLRHAVWARSSGLEANVLVPPVLEGVGLQYPINHFCRNARQVRAFDYFIDAAQSFDAFRYA